MNEEQIKELMNNLYFCDVEADGPIPGIYSMVSVGVSKMNKDGTLSEFYSEIKPISEKWIPDALAVSRFTREQTQMFSSPTVVMKNLENFIKTTIQKGEKPVFISDNPAFDWQFVNYYFHLFLGSNPFGFSARRIGDYYAGLTKNFYNSSNWKKLRGKDGHTHNALEDARGNLKAFYAMHNKNTH